MDLWPSLLGHWFYGSAVNSLNKDFAWPLGSCQLGKTENFALMSPQEGLHRLQATLFGGVPK